jgi:Zn-finger protein
MKHLRFLLAVVIVALPLAAWGAAEMEKKAATIDELAKMFDVSSCKGCHQQIFDEWEKSIHAISLVGTPRTMATIKSAVTDGMMKEWVKSGVKEVKDVKVEHMMSCTKCHLPQLKYATDAVAAEIAQAAIDGSGGDEAAVAKLKKLGINCLICHNMKAITHKWVDGEPEKNAVYGSKEGSHADKVFTMMKKSPIMGESIVCGQCHGLGPNFDLAQPTQCATLYGSYLHAYVPSAGVEIETCQDCHMKKSKKGHLMPSYRDPDTAKSAVNVDVDTKGYYVLYKAGDSIPTAAVQVKITSNAGHRIPDG